MSGTQKRKSKPKSERPGTHPERNPQRSDKKRCGAKVRSREDADGLGCRQLIEQDATRCRYHGGGTKAAKAKAAERKQERQMREVLGTLDIVPVADPLTELSKVAGEITAWKDLMALHVGELKNLGYAGENGEQIKAEVTLYERALDRCVSVLAAIGRLDIDNRLAKISEKQAEMVERAIEAAFLAVGLGPEETEKAWAAVGKHLRAVS